MIKKRRARMRKVRRDRDWVNQELSAKLLTDFTIRSRKVGFGGGARKAIEKSWVWMGDEGVTMMAGNGDFSVMEGRERS
jgi:hypothetical protein